MIFFFGMSDRTIPYVMVQKMKQPIAVKSTYEPRNPTASHYYRCIEANFEELEWVWDDRYKRRYGCCAQNVREP